MAGILPNLSQSFIDLDLEVILERVFMLNGLMRTQLKSKMRSLFECLVSRFESRGFINVT